MPRLAAIAALAFMFGPTAVAQTTNLPPPIEPAAQGKMQCYSPNPETKTCQSLAAYRPVEDAGIENMAHVLVLVAPAIVMTVTSEVTIRGGQVCGYVRAADYDKASFTVDGVAANAEMTANFRARVGVLYGSTLEREVCTAYKPQGDGFITSVTVDGAPQANAEMRVIWVSPSDGYRVGP